jgi:hypothetical protein
MHRFNAKCDRFLLVHFRRECLQIWRTWLEGPQSQGKIGRFLKMRRRHVLAQKLH